MQYHQSGTFTESEYGFLFLNFLPRYQSRGMESTMSEPTPTVLRETKIGQKGFINKAGSEKA